MSKRIRIVVCSIVALSVVALCLVGCASSKPPSKSMLKIQMISIPAGSFLMGNSGVGNDKKYSNPTELPKHSVTLSAYSIGKYEVTRGQYKQFIKAGGYSNKSYWSNEGWKWKISKKRTEPESWAAKQTWGKQTFTQTDNHPVVSVCYYEAEAFCNWAGGHLPTEAQWERAARWNSKTKHANVYPWGDVWDAEKCNNFADHNSAGGGYKRYQTAPVGSYPSGASPSGCQDMAGNVWEWCKDWYGDKYYSKSPKSNPQGPASGSFRFVRGGGWCGSYGGLDVDSVRCACRSIYGVPSYGNGGVGFRLVR
ncbi:MAG: formylglycine-generating enzyme family protein [Armatimonadetes bacterium]|nr:formylglycine-generating enzyme family protein [Armatimonadota bacterium]